MIFIPLQHVLSMTAGRVYTMLGVPSLRFWCWSKGCDRVTLNEFERVGAFWGYFMLPVMLHQGATSLPILHAEINKTLEDKDSQKKVPKTLQYITAIVVSFWLFGLVFVSQAAFVLGSFPGVKRYPDGKWRLRHRPRRFPIMEMNGVMKFEDLEQEETAPPDGQDMVTENGRFPDPDKTIMPAWIWTVAYICAFFLAIIYWSYRLSQHILLSALHKLTFKL